jgi:hypothetical protein
VVGTVDLVNAPCDHVLSPCGRGLAPANPPCGRLRSDCPEHEHLATVVHLQTGASRTRRPLCTSVPFTLQMTVGLTLPESAWVCPPIPKELPTCRPIQSTHSCCVAGHSP